MHEKCSTQRRNISEAQNHKHKRANACRSKKVFHVAHPAASARGTDVKLSRDRFHRPADGFALPIYNRRQSERAVKYVSTDYNAYKGVRSTSPQRSIGQAGGGAIDYDSREEGMR